MDDEHEDKRFDQGNTQGGIPRDGAESDNGIQSNQKKDSGNGRGDVVGQTDHEVDGRGDPQDGNGRQTIIGASLWDGPTPSPEDMAGFKTVDPTFPERIMRMSEETVRTKNKAMLRSSTLESWAVLITSASMSALPWVICFTGVLNGNNAAAVIGGIAGPSRLRLKPDTGDQEQEKRLKHSHPGARGMRVAGVFFYKESERV